MRNKNESSATSNMMREHKILRLSFTQTIEDILSPCSPRLYMFPLRFAHRMRLSWRSVTSWLTPTSFMLTSAWDKNLSRYFVNFWSNQTELEDFLLISYLMLGFLLTLRVSYRKTIQAKAGIWTINIKVGNVLDSNVWSMFCFMPSIRRNCGQPVKNNFSPRFAATRLNSGVLIGGTSDWNWVQIACIFATPPATCVCLVGVPAMMLITQGIQSLVTNFILHPMASQSYRQKSLMIH